MVCASRQLTQHSQSLLLSCQSKSLYIRDKIKGEGKRKALVREGDGGDGGVASLRRGITWGKAIG